MFEWFSYGVKGEKDIFLSLLERRIDVLYRIAYSYFKDSNTAADIVQDSILIAYKNLHRLKDKEKFNSWITSILINKCREILRKNKKISFQQLDETVIDIHSISIGNPEFDYKRIDDRIDVLNLLQRLDEKYRDVIRLKYLGDYTIADIALILNIPVGTVKSRLNTGLKLLKSMMEVKNNVV